jgi:regulator of nucleoside diphosphate kinase
MERQIHITAQDRCRLLDCLGVLREYPDKRELPHIRYLEKEIAGAQLILDPLMTPKDVITMRSRVKLKNMATQAQMECTLVYPSERAPEEGRISVLAPLGVAMLGYRVGDTFEVDLPKGRTQFLVDAVTYQPESSGDYHL